MFDCFLYKSVESLYCPDEEGLDLDHFVNFARFLSCIVRYGEKGRKYGEKTFSTVVLTLLKLYFG